ncbi:hemerythrin domain-containing protein [Chitinispirillales bacterium ANBcel5]|uniref:hemerythrin domain-containing protein n=1 Tax=Cellulosispirillum alkaliphilum TaxID=3039283 RepID=UPI002A4FB6B7|nr:hemerythrin domain-containing protein [Chitinispirillales bacterium ANBcel5]
MMHDIINTNIIDLIKKYPPIEQHLAAFEIGCVTCSLGTCKLGDVVEIHNLSVAQEKELMSKIAKTVFPGQEVELPVSERKQSSTDKSIIPPVRELIDEHRVIKRLIAVIPSITEKAILEQESDYQLYKEILTFIADYADGFHHAKEEKILFDYFDKDSDIITSFLKEHETGRSYVRNAREALESADLATLRENLIGYATLLKEHIQKEDEILFPWMNRSLSDNQVGMLFSRFGNTNKEYQTIAAEQKKVIDELENRFG